MLGSPPKVQIKTFNILGINFSAVNLPEACQYIEELLLQKAKTYVCVCPVSTIMAAQEDEEFRNIVNSADLVTTDGMPSVWIGKLKGYKSIGRVYGPDLMLKFCELSQAKGYRHYFYGATEEVLHKLSRRLKERFPRLVICGQYAPAFRELTEEEDQVIVDQINATNPDIVWVGLGSPKQDLWITRHRDRVDASVFLAVGAAFDFLSGNKPQAPRWIQRAGLEWFFRLCCEPHRLWYRYLIGNTKFIYLLVKDCFRKNSR